MITISYAAIESMALPAAYLDIPTSLPGGLLCFYKVPDSAGTGVTYQVFYNTGPMEQRPHCACEEFTLLGKYSIDEDHVTYKVIFEHSDVNSTITISE